MYFIVTNNIFLTGFNCHKLNLKMIGNMI